LEGDVWLKPIFATRDGQIFGMAARRTNDGFCPLFGNYTHRPPWRFGRKVSRDKIVKWLPQLPFMRANSAGPTL
jgi:hypothetical protein